MLKKKHKSSRRIALACVASSILSLIAIIYYVFFSQLESSSISQSRYAPIPADRVIIVDSRNSRTRPPTDPLNSLKNRGRPRNSNPSKRHGLFNMTVEEVNQCRNVAERSPPFFLSSSSRPSSFTPPLLYSFPGSGNTWLRLLIDWSTGIYTGSFYDDKDLLRILPGESRCDKSVSAIKAHPHINSFESILAGDLPPKCSTLLRSKKASSDHNSGNKDMHVTTPNPFIFDKVILLIRDPYDSIWSEFQRRKSGSHVRGVRNTIKMQKSWTAVYKELAEKYVDMMTKDYPAITNGSSIENRNNVVGERGQAPSNTQIKSLTIRYEDLRNPSLAVKVLQEIIEFIFPPSFGLVGGWEHDMERKLRCAFVLADNPVAHRPASINTLRGRAGTDMKKEEAYTYEVVCEIWKKVGKHATKLGYKPFANNACVM